MARSVIAEQRFVGRLDPEAREKYLYSNSRSKQRGGGSQAGYHRATSDGDSGSLSTKDNFSPPLRRAHVFRARPAATFFRR